MGLEWLLFNPRIYLYFTSSRGENGYPDIYQVTYDGKDQTFQRVTNTQEIEQSPIVSNDGEMILYKVGGLRLENSLNLLILDSMSTSEVARGDFFSPGEWSPDDKKVAYLSDWQSGSYQLFLLDIETMNHEVVPISLEDYEVVDVTWSPNGSTVAIATLPNRYSTNSGRSQIWLFQFDNQTLTPLTSVRDGDCQWPAWAPKDEWIAVVCRREDDHGQLYLFSTDGEEKIQITENPDTISSDLKLLHNPVTWVRTPHWLPNSENILYVAAPQLDGDWILYMTNISGDFHEPILHDPGLWGDISVQK